MPTFDQEAINKDLKEKSSDFQKKVLSEANSYLKSSADKMSGYWTQWDLAQANFKGYRITDKEDRKSLSEGRPVKLVVPVTYAQVQTAVSFLHSIFTQKGRIFEFTAGGPEDASLIEAMETDIEYQMRKTKFLMKLHLWLLDICKFGVGVLKISWEERYAMMRIAKKQSQMPDIMNVLGGLFKGQGLNMTATEVTVESIEEVLQYEGNKIDNISPYCFFPDPGLPVARFQEGAYVAHEEILSKNSIVCKEGKIFFGTKHIEPFNDTVTETSQNRRSRWFQREFREVDRAMGQTKIDTNSVIHTEIQMNIIPKDWTEKFGINFGDEDKPIKFVAVIANDTKLIRFERLDYLHGDYTYAIAEYNVDHNLFLSGGMAETIRELQDIMSWLFNSHMANISKIINNQVLADSTKVHVEDIVDRKTVIRSKGTPTGDISKSVYQFTVTDATNGHFTMSDAVMRLIQLTTGVNENALGAYAPGRRSAFESKQVNAGAALRMKSLALLIWSQGLEPAGQQILSNTRQARTKETYDKIVGKLAEKAPYEKVILTDPTLLAGGYDLLPFDGTLPSEKDEKAGYLLELFKSCLQNPQVAQALNLDVNKLLEGIAELKGIDNLDDYKVQQMVQGEEPNPMMQQNEVSVVPDADIAAMLQQGQIEPLPEGINPLEAFSNGR